MNSSLWVRDYCPQCKLANWAYQGKFEEHDDTDYVCEGLVCWNCGHAWVFSPEFWREDKATSIISDEESDFEDVEETFIKTGEYGGHDFDYWIHEYAHLEKGKHLEEVK
jgi:hypothetical protein